jgi:hypothetical protein
MKHVCKNCLEKYSKKKNFPSFTLFGGILGTLGSLFFGPIAMIPSIFAGAAADVIKCRICGSTDDLYEVKETDRWDKPIPRAHLKQFEGRRSLEDDTFDLELENQQPDLPETQFTLDNQDIGNYEISFDTGRYSLDIDSSFDIGDADAGFGESDSGESGDAGGSEGSEGS